MSMLSLCVYYDLYGYITQGITCWLVQYQYLLTLCPTYLTYSMGQNIYLDLHS